MKRPLAYAGGAFFLTLIIVNCFGFNCGIILGTVSLITVLGFLALPFLKKNSMWGIPAFFIFLACVIFCLSTMMTVIPIQSLEGKSMEIEATLTELPEEKQEYCLYTVKTKAVLDNGNTKDVKFKFTHDKIINLEPYDRMKMEVTFYELEEKYRASSFAQNIFISAKCDTPVEVVKVDRKPLAHYPLELRQKLINLINGTYGAEISGLMCGISTGNTELMTDEIYQGMKASGLYHVTAVSGLHITIIAQALTSLLMKLRIKKQYCYLLSLVPVWGFVLVSGMPYSSIRSAIMFSLMSLSLAFFRKSDSITSLFSALIICGFVNPFCAMDAGLLSSASAVLGLLVLASPLNKILTGWLPEKISKNPLISYTTASFSTTLAAVLGLLPCTILFFKTFSPISFVANLTVLPFVTVLLFCTLAAGCLSFLPFISNPLLLAAGICSKIIIFLTGFFEGLPYAQISFSRSYLLIWIAAVMLLSAVVILFYSFGKGNKRLIALLVAFCILSLGVAVVSNELFNRNTKEVYLIDNKDNLCTLTVYKGEVSVIYCSLDYEGVSRLRYILQSIGKTKIDWMFMQETPNVKVVKRITERIKVENLCVHKKLESSFPAVIKDSVKCVRFCDIFSVTKKGVRVDFCPKLHQMSVTMPNFTYITFSKSVSQVPSVFPKQSLVFTTLDAASEALEKSPCAVIISCSQENKAEASEFLSSHGITGYYTADYGSLYIRASNNGQFSVSRLNDG